MSKEMADAVPAVNEAGGEMSQSSFSPYPVERYISTPKFPPPHFVPICQVLPSLLASTTVHRLRSEASSNAVVWGSGCTSPAAAALDVALPPSPALFFAVTVYE